MNGILIVKQMLNGHSIIHLRSIIDFIFSFNNTANIHLIYDPRYEKYVHLFPSVNNHKTFSSGMKLNSS